MGINITASPGGRAAYVRPHMDAVQTKGRTAVNSRDVVTISAQAREVMAKQEARVNSADSASAVSEGRINVISSAFTSFAEEFSKITKDYADTIREYYAAEHEENLTYDNPSAHIWDKYKNPESPYFRSDLSEDERAWAYDYEQDLLRGGKHLQIRNLYAFADAGGPPTLADAAMRAIQACREQINRSIQDIFAENGIEVPASFRLTVDPSDYSIHVSGLEDKELAETIEQALNQGSNGKNLYDYLKLTAPGSGELEVDCVDGHLPAVDPQQELDDETLAEVKNQTCPAWARYNDYDPHKGPLGTMTNPLGDIEGTPEEQERINSGIRMSAPEVIAEFRDLPQQTLEMSWWEKFGAEIGMTGDEVYRIAKETYYHAYIEHVENTRKTIEAYYADDISKVTAYGNAMAQKNHSDPLTESLTYLAQMYLWSPDSDVILSAHPEYFRWDMSAEERRITYDQQRSLLVLGRIATLYDPRALASVGGPITVEDSHEYAVQAVRDKLEELRKQAQDGES